MTQNQIAYWELEEKKRSNRVQEGETKRHNVATEFIQAGTLEENKRHNVVSEGIAFGTLAETERSNKARESETHRTNLANEALKHESNLYSREVGMAQVAESNRHNVATENETARHNMASEEYNYYQTNTNRMLQERGYDIKDNEVLISQGNLDFKYEQLYGGKGYDLTERQSSHAFSGSGTGGDSYSPKIPTLEREYKEKTLQQADKKLTQEWFSIGSNFIKNSSYLMRNVLPYIVPTSK